MNRASLPGNCLTWSLEHGEILLSRELFAEYRDVLNRPKIVRYTPPDARRAVLSLFELSSIWIDVDVEITACRDPKDNHLLELAVSGHADALVTGDEDLLILNGKFPFAILSPRDFLNFLAG